MANLFSNERQYLLILVFVKPTTYTFSTWCIRMTAVSYLVHMTAVSYLVHMTAVSYLVHMTAVSYLVHMTAVSYLVHTYDSCLLLGAYV